MNAPVRGALLLISVAALGACGDTYVETSVTTAPAAVSTTTVPPVSADTPVDELLEEIETLLFDLDERIIDGRQPAATLARIEELWDAAEPQIRATDLDAVYQFEIALDLARTGVTRKRPADASKSYKIMQQVVDAYIRT